MQNLRGFSPERHEKPTDDGHWAGHGDAPAFIGQDGGASVRLDPRQHAAYLVWRAGFGMPLEAALPELSGDEREALLSGLRSDTFADIMGGR